MSNLSKLLNSAFGFLLLISSFDAAAQLDCIFDKKYKEMLVMENRCNTDMLVSFCIKETTRPFLSNVNCHLVRKGSEIKYQFWITKPEVHDYGYRYTYISPAKVGEVERCPPRPDCSGLVASQMDTDTGGGKSSGSYEDYGTYNYQEEKASLEREHEEMRLELERIAADEELKAQQEHRRREAERQRRLAEQQREEELARNLARVRQEQVAREQMADVEAEYDDSGEWASILGGILGGVILYDQLGEDGANQLLDSFGTLANPGSFNQTLDQGITDVYEKLQQQELQRQQAPSVHMQKNRHNSYQPCVGRKAGCLCRSTRPHTKGRCGHWIEASESGGRWFPAMCQVCDYVGCGQVCEAAGI